MTASGTAEEAGAGEAPMPGLLGPLRHPGFALIAGASLVSDVGAWMRDTTSAWTVAGEAHHHSAVALAQAATAPPGFLLALPAGVLADHHDRRRLLIPCQLALAVAGATLAALSYAHVPSVGAIVVLALFAGSAAALAASAFQAIVPRLVHWMVVAPGSMRTVGEVASCATSNLLTRAADVCLKERRRLVLMVREAPLHAGHRRAMLAATEAGAVIFPPVPACYAKPTALAEMVDHTVGRVLDLFDLDAGQLRWDGRPPRGAEVIPLPATAEIVVEGHVSRDETAPEGSMGEYAGYLWDGPATPKPVYIVSAITHGTKPILPISVAGGPLEENHTAWGVPNTGEVLFLLREAGFPAATAWSPLESANHRFVVAVERNWRARFPGKTTTDMCDWAARALSGKKGGMGTPKWIVVNDDVDISKTKELVWAFAPRNPPGAPGELVFGDENANPLAYWSSYGYPAATAKVPA